MPHDASPQQQPSAPGPRTSPALRELDLEAHLRDPARRQAFVTPMFDLIAPRYDRFTRVFSFGMDAGWKRQLVRWMRDAVRPGATVLDIACGTGDLAFAAARLATGGRVTGVDASPRMIEQARRRARDEEGVASAVRFAVGDMMRLDAPDASVDVVTAGYALRNAPDFRVALDEIARVLRPGGVLLTLDFYRPRSVAWRAPFLAYLAAAGNVVGWLWHREPVAYGYIARSIEHFVSWQDFAAALAERGLAVEEVRRKLLGGIALHRARRGAG